MGFFGRLIRRRREEANEASENVLFKELVLRAASRYDAARPSRELDAYWSRADSLGGDAALDPDTRRRLRERSRYEFANNCYARGAGLLWANAVVGSGPRPQLLGDDRKFNKRVEWAFCEWAEEIGLAAKLRSMKVSRFVDGEAFALLHGNPNLAGPVKLDVSPFDAERVRAPLRFERPARRRRVENRRIRESGFVSSRVDAARRLVGRLLPLRFAAVGSVELGRRDDVQGERSRSLVSPNVFRATTRGTGTRRRASAFRAFAALHLGGRRGGGDRGGLRGRP